MPALANREKYEQALQLDLAILLHQFAAVALRNPRNFPTNAAAGLTRVALIPQLEAIYRAAAEQAARETQTPVDRLPMLFAARRWAVQAADDLAQRITGSIQQRLQEAQQEALNQQTAAGLILLPMLDDIFGGGRAKRHSVTETTRGVTAGEEHVISKTNLIAFWNVDFGGTKTGPCEVCEPLHGLPRDKWPSWAKAGPPVHEHCACFLTYE